MKTCVVVGAGISGLSLAWALRSRGVGVVVLEREARAGGKIHTERADGFTCEWGPQSFSFRDPCAARLVGELGLAPRLVEAAAAASTRGVLAGGEILPVPLTLAAFVRSPLLTPAAKWRAALDLVLPRGGVGAGEEESVADFGARRLGPAAARRLFFPLVSGLYAGAPDKVSVGAAFPSLADLERRHRSLLWGAAVTRWRSRVAGARIATFAGGMEELTLALARGLGPALRLSSTVAAVRRDGEGFAVEVDRDGRAEGLRADAVALASPSHATAPLVQGLDAALAEAVGQIPYVPVALVWLGYSPGALARPPSSYGFMVPPDEPSRILGAVFTSAVFPSHAPEGVTLLAARVGGSRHPERASLPDAELVEAVHAELARPLGARAGPAFSRVLRHALALPQYTVGHAARVAVIDAAEARHRGLFVTGNAVRGLGIADCIRNAPQLADRIADFLATGAER